MSYAAVAAKGPKQSAEEKRAPAPPSIEHTDSPSTSSLIDVDTASVHTVPSDFSTASIQTDTQAARLEREASASEARAEAETQAKRAKAELERKEKAAKAKAKRAGESLQANSDNPVFVGNALLAVGLSGLLGFGAYKKHARGELTWGVVGAWAGVVGLFAVGEYYASQYLLKNKCPRK